MNTSEKMKQILSLNEQEKFELEKDVLHFSFMSHIQEHMGEMKNKDLAEKIGVTKSFVSQLFKGNKKLNIDIMVKCQRALKFKFIVDAKSVDNKQEEDHSVRPLFHYSQQTILTNTTKSIPSVENIEIKQAI